MEGQKINVLYGKDDKMIHASLVELIIQSNSNILIIDIKRIWQPLTIHKKVKILQPISKIEFFNIMYKLENYINPRLKIIIIDGIFQYLREYIGKSAKENVINKKMYAMFLTLCNNILLNYKIQIFITSHVKISKKLQPLLNDINHYYNVKEYLIN